MSFYVITRLGNITLFFFPLFYKGGRRFNIYSQGRVQTSMSVSTMRKTVPKTNMQDVCWSGSFPCHNRSRARQTIVQSVQLAYCHRIMARKRGEALTNELHQPRVGIDHDTTRALLLLRDDVGAHTVCFAVKLLISCFSTKPSCELLGRAAPKIPASLRQSAQQPQTSGYERKVERSGLQQFMY